MRKLVWASLSFSGAIALAHYLIPASARYDVVGVLLFLAILAFLGGRAQKGKRCTIVLLLCVFGALGILRYEMQERWVLDAVKPLIGKTHRVSAVVQQYPDLYEGYARVTVRLHQEDFPSVKTVLYEYEGEADDLAPGDLISARVKFSSAQVSSGEPTDSYLSKGIYLRGSLQGKLWRDGSWEWSGVFAPLRLSREICERLDTYLSPEAAAFSKALLTGNKADLYEEVELYHNLSRAGLAHIVAVSGMHMAFVVGLILAVMGNRHGWLFAISGGVAFVCMTGMSPSVMRALLMQLLFLLSPVVRREPDGLTTISFALLILLLYNPFFVASLSLQLSFASMLGIVLITPKVTEWLQERWKWTSGFGQKVGRFVSVSFAASLGASGFTLPLCGIYFGYVSLLAPLSNLLILWLIPYCFAGGLLLCVVSLLSQSLASGLGWVLSSVIALIGRLVKWIAAIPIASVYLPEKLLMGWMLLAYGFVFLMAWKHHKQTWRPMVTACLLVGSLLGLYGCVKLYYETGTTVAAVDVEQGQCIVMLEGEQTVLIDCGGIYDAGERTARWLYAHGRERVDTLVLTHLDRDHVNAVSDLVYLIPVDEIIYSDFGLTQSKREILNTITSCGKETGTKLTRLKKTATDKIGDAFLTYYVSEHSGRNTGLMVLAQVGEFDMLVSGDASAAAERELIREHRLPDGELLVVGHHGSDTSTSPSLLRVFRPEMAVISCGYNAYGHPTKEVLDRLEGRNMVIYRTDQSGSIEIKVR